MFFLSEIVVSPFVFRPVLRLLFVLCMIIREALSACQRFCGFGRFSRISGIIVEYTHGVFISSKYGSGYNEKA
jgi:hypothetical protein